MSTNLCQECTSGDLLGRAPLNPWLLPCSPPDLCQECTGGDLFDRILREKAVGEQSAAKAIHAVMAAVQHCHGMNVVHRGIKVRGGQEGGKGRGRLGAGGEAGGGTRWDGKGSK